MKTSQKQISKNGEVKSMFSQEDFPANHSVLQEREREQKITATSGRTCYEQYGKFSPLGLLVKTLLESSRWYSQARRLIWVAKPLYLKRITEQERSSSACEKAREVAGQKAKGRSKAGGKEKSCTEQHDYKDALFNNCAKRSTGPCA